MCGSQSRWGCSAHAKDSRDGQRGGQSKLQRMLREDPSPEQHPVKGWQKEWDPPSAAGIPLDLILVSLCSEQQVELPRLSVSPNEGKGISGWEQGQRGEFYILPSMSTIAWIQKETVPQPGSTSL